MKLLLDTTYLLPAIGVAIGDIPDDAVVRVLERGHEVYVSEISFFELAAKGAKYVTVGELSAERVSKGMRALVYDERLRGIPAYETSVLLAAFTLRRRMNDFIDCIILSSALNKCEVLITEDKRIHKLEERMLFREIIKVNNPEFKIKKISELLEL
jgi:PIN domain nuclease of toxin-antitoxin system